MSLPELTEQEQHSYVIVPANHRFLTDGGKFYKKHGKVSTIGMARYLRVCLAADAGADEEKAIKLIIKGFPAICEYITNVLSLEPTLPQPNGSIPA